MCVLPQESTEDEEQWEVEEIVDYQYCRQSEAGLYLVKWIGWASEHNTWEPGKSGQNWGREY